MTTTAPWSGLSPVRRRLRTRTIFLVLVILPAAFFLLLQVGTMFNDVSAECTYAEARAGNQVCLTMTDGALILTVAHGLHFGRESLPPTFDLKWDASWANRSSTIWLPRIDRSAKGARFSETFVAMPAWLVALLSISPLVGPWLARRRRAAVRLRQGQCAACGYNTTGLKAARCPECGAATSGSVAGRVFTG